jgi:hypothetical protein
MSPHDPTHRPARTHVVSARGVEEAEQQEIRGREHFRSSMSSLVCWWRRAVAASDVGGKRASGCRRLCRWRSGWWRAVARNEEDERHVVVDRWHAATPGLAMAATDGGEALGLEKRSARPSRFGKMSLGIWDPNFIWYLCSLVPPLLFFLRKITPLFFS